MRLPASLVVLLALLLLPARTPAQSPQRLGYLISGHSLTDEPIGAYVELIARSRGHEVGWQRQSIPGSPIISRTIGHRDDPRQPGRFPWRGYASGAGRDGQSVDLIAELRRPATLGAGKTYTHLIVAERHDSLGPLQWEQTVPLLRHFYELAREGSPGVRGYFYATWADLTGPGSGRDDPAGWVRYEREQLKVWEAITSRINDSLAREGRKDRMATLPASGALAELVERAVAGRVPGVSAGSARATVDRLFSDDVHQTPLGKYYTACVVYASISGRSPVGAAHPPEVSAEAARSLQSLAAEYVAGYYRASRDGPHHDVDARLSIASRFAPIFWTYHRRPDQARGGAEFFGRRTPANPLWFDRAADESTFWLPRLP